MKRKIQRPVKQGQIPWQTIRAAVKKVIHDRMKSKSVMVKAGKPL